MHRILIKVSFGLCVFPLLCSCADTTKTPRRHIHAGRITSQQGHSVVIYPERQENPLPKYSWPTPQRPVITKYSFHCHGSLTSIETEKGTIYDCDGLNHSLYKTFPIHSRIIAITRLIHAHSTLSIIEGFCCHKHVRFLKASGKNLSNKHLEGNAALLFSDKELSVETLRSILHPLYKKKCLYPCSIEFITTETTLSNEEFIITLIRENKGTYLAIEMLYDLENAQPVRVPPSPLS
ncbi:hypothetical protein [Chlamydia caviae]|uniref:Lipoprotein n=1 Tax=Chlamydia caviae (strain ATCC VR-813 / DSM 19441 / 03DC25 / GPIC) TaxID=227941 RepID=Q824I6_CHLCV|nr:hypothetical protein [Chlamydia caviae]AAP04911.1 conserved hypothetical protein [Chlamydia caviae GPIC]